jgi:hypothetical protein
MLIVRTCNFLSNVNEKVFNGSWRNKYQCKYYLKVIKIENSIKTLQFKERKKEIFSPKRYHWKKERKIDFVHTLLTIITNDHFEDFTVVCLINIQSENCVFLTDWLLTKHICKYNNNNNNNNRSMLYWSLKLQIKSLKTHNKRNYAH